MVKKVERAYSREVTGQYVSRLRLVSCATITDTHGHCGWKGRGEELYELAYQMIHRHPGLGITNTYGIPDGPERVHWEAEFAQKIGVPGAHDYGPERCSWHSHAVTNWFGDDGILHKLSCEIRRHNPEGDTLFRHASVTGKYASHGKAYGELALVAENQDSELSARGPAVAQLPG